MLTDPIEISLLVTTTLERLGISYLIGGSLASSIHGIARATCDIDIVADIHGNHVEAMVNALNKEF